MEQSLMSGSLMSLNMAKGTVLIEPLLFSVSMA